jgi:hypothetical protein
MYGGAALGMLEQVSSAPTSAMRLRRGGMRCERAGRTTEHGRVTAKLIAQTARTTGDTARGHGTAYLAAGSTVLVDNVETTIVSGHAIVSVAFFRHACGSSPMGSSYIARSCDEWIQADMQNASRTTSLGLVLCSMAGTTGRTSEYLLMLSYHGHSALEKKGTS